MKKIIATRFSLKQNRFFLRAQAFTSPTDMASSGVRENVNLSITPTLDGVCGMLFYIILIFWFIAKWLCINIFGCFWPTCCELEWQMFLSHFCEPMEILADVICLLFCNGWCCCHCGMYICHCFYIWKLAPHYIIYLWQMLWPHWQWLMLLPWW